MFTMLTMIAVVSVSAVEIDLATIRQIESGGNDRAVSKADCHGPYQFTKDTWTDCVKRMGVNYVWDDVYNPSKAGKVAQWYLSNRIPAMLRYYGVPVTVESVLSSYNAGIGVVTKGYRSHGRDWLAKMPLETKRYILKYKKGI